MRGWRKQEWERLGSARGLSDFGRPAMSIRPSNLSFEILVRYVTRANDGNSKGQNCISMLSNCCAEKYSSAG